MGCIPSSILVWEEDGVEAAANLLADLQQGHQLPRASGALHFQVFAVEEVVPLKTLQDEVVH